MDNKDHQKVQPVQSNSKLKSYYCPYCRKLIIKGDIKRLSMTCPNCYKLINVEEEDLL